MKTRYYFSGAAILIGLALLVAGETKAAWGFFGLSTVIELVAAMLNDKNSNT